ncbi:MAG: hypothetical protein HY652_06190 [Acidobacteria bacterium]|nr:hypothetical protein [Acidobacteriota bacterium]
MRERGFATGFAAGGFTMRRGFFRFRLDSVFTRGVEVREGAVERSVRGSDHLPLWVELAWPSNAPVHGP